MKKTHEGSCHCGRVKFTVELDASAPSGRCNCTVCTKTSMTTQIVKPNDFKLLAGEADLSTYEWGAKIGKRFFCKHCGVSCFGSGHLKEVGGDYVSVNMLCLDAIDPATLTLQYWDGRHNGWDKGPRDRAWPIFEMA